MDVDYLKTLVVAVLDDEENTDNSDAAYAAIAAAETCRRCGRQHDEGVTCIDACLATVASK